MFNTNMWASIFYRKLYFDYFFFLNDSGNTYPYWFTPMFNAV